MDTKENKQENRKKLKDLATSPETMKAFSQLIMERIQNLSVVTRKGSSPTQCLMSEICVLEAKVDALMALLEEKHDIDFTNFNDHLENSAKIGAATAISIRAQMMRS